MNDKQVFECEFCAKLYRRASNAAKHENMCFSNPKREIQRGELASVDWYTWGVGEKKCNPKPSYIWLPAEPGAIWTGEFWLKVDDYYHDWSDETWPSIWFDFSLDRDGPRYDSLSTKERWPEFVASYLEYEYEGVPWCDGDDVESFTDRLNKYLRMQVFAPMLSQGDTQVERTGMEPQLSSTQKRLDDNQPRPILSSFYRDKLKSLSLKERERLLFNNWDEWPTH